MRRCNFPEKLKKEGKMKTREKKKKEKEIKIRCPSCNKEVVPDGCHCPECGFLFQYWR